MVESVVILVTFSLFSEEHFHIYQSSAFFSSHYEPETPNISLRRASGIDIYFQNLMISQIVHTEGYSLFTLLCDIGGALGLLLGASVLTVGEVLDYFFYGCWVWPNTVGYRIKQRSKVETIKVAPLETKCVPVD